LLLLAPSPFAPDPSETCLSGLDKAALVSQDWADELAATRRLVFEILPQMQFGNRVWSHCVILNLSKMVDRTWVSPGRYRRSCSTAISNPANRPRTSMKDEVYSSSNRR
jgi:hypothetical protein